MKPKKYFSLAKDGRNVDIMIYGDIVSYKWLDSDVTAYDLAQAIDDLTDIDTITVGINSYGGDVAQGLAIYNALKRSPAQVVTRCDGFACSAASVVFAAGDSRIMYDSSLIMIHNAWTYAEGDANTMRDVADMLDKVTEPSIKAYKSVMDLTEDEIREMMDKETWITADEALDYGLATSIIKEKTDKTAQSARKAVYQMIINPYQAADDDEIKCAGEDEDETTTDSPADAPDDTDTTADNDNSDDNPGTEDDNTDTSDDNTDDSTDEDKANQMVCNFLNAIFR